jgi:isoleucyl-tRNA synthetase
MTNKTHKIKSVDNNPDFPSLEKDLLESWYKKGVVDKYLTKNKDSKKRFSFFDGPITANNPMGVHHAWGRTYKDFWQRFYTAKGCELRYQNGFDCQGLWVEVEVEKELGLHTKKDIEKYGVAEFVAKCKERVLKYAAIQTDQSKRLGYFMDWENSYFTMSDENNFTIWHFLKTCWEKGWIYKGHDSVPWCPRCETAISQHEMLTEDYKELTHKSLIVEFPIVDRNHEYLLVWTTTPWTIPANIAVAVEVDLEYQLIEGNSGSLFWVAKDRLEDVFKGEYKSVIKTVKGRELVGLKYKGPFDELPAVKEVADHPLFHTVVATDKMIMPISSTEGTGMVHTAVSAGTEDFALGKKIGLPMIPIIADNADYLPGLDFLSGLNAKKHPEIIIDYLKECEGKGDNWLFRVENYTHRYPACWRCKTELVWKVTDEWYISMDRVDPADKAGRTLRQKMIDVTKKINWMPEFGLDRELDWLGNMHDWLISKKNRYWGLSLPIWECDNCGHFEVVGGIDELKSKTIAGWDELEGKSPHKPQIDAIKLKCPKCDSVISRIEPVGNPWLDAGIIPFSTLVDPATGKVSFLSDKKYFEKWFPADFITESFPGQFKNWFYSLIAMSSVLTDNPPFKNVLGYASVLAEDGRAMHKSWGNSIEFNEGADNIGVDVMRWSYLRQSPERNLLFGYKMTADLKRQFHMMLWNSYRFFVNFAELENWQPSIELNQVPSILDQWILGRLNQTLLVVTPALENFDAQTAAISIEEFVNDLSTWYIRRSRDRIGPSVEESLDKELCYRTLYTVFTILSRTLMPFMPFMSELMYQNLTGEESVHLSSWPEVNTPDVINKDLLDDMKLVRSIVELGHSERKLQNIPVRQPLANIEVIGAGKVISDEVSALILDELNIEEIIWNQGEELKIKLDTTLTPELIAKGEARGIIRQIQQARKEVGCGLDEAVDVVLPDWPKEFEEDIKKKTLAINLIKGDSLEIKR